MYKTYMFIRSCNIEREMSKEVEGPIGFDYWSPVKFLGFPFQIILYACYKIF